MENYRKIFYFKNKMIFTAEGDSNMSLKELEEYYYKRIKKGKTIIETTEKDETFIIDLKQVQTIKIERIDN